MVNKFECYFVSVIQFQYMTYRHKLDWQKGIVCYLRVSFIGYTYYVLVADTADWWTNYQFVCTSYYKC